MMSLTSSDQNAFGTLVKWGLIAFVTLAAVLIALSVLLSTQRKDGLYAPYAYGYGPFFPFHLEFFPLLPVGGILLIAAIFLIGRWVLWRGRQNYCIGETNEANPIKIAQERYAKGELTRERFEQMVQDIQKINEANDSTT